MIAILLSIIALLILAAATEHQRAVDLEASAMEVERHAIDLEQRADSFEIERDRAYATIRALHTQVKELERRSARIVCVPCGRPLEPVTIDERFVVNVGRN